MKQLRYFMSAVAMSTALAGVAVAQKAPNGLSIIQKVYNRDQPKDQEGKLTMTLINSRGEKRVREIRQFIKDDGTVEKKIMFFTAPADVRNTSFMNWSYTKSDKEDNQWIYLPALKKTKRISSEGKSDYFMGSDFTYDDLGDRLPEQDVHTFVREESLNGAACYVIKSVPKDKNYMYSATVTWVDKEKWIGLKKEFYDEDGVHLKTLTVVKNSQIGKYWLIGASEMHNVKKNHRTSMELKDLTVDKGISDGQFTERTMMRGL